MDSLSDIPAQETQLSEQEATTLKKYFGDSAPPTKKTNWKFLFYVLMLFFLLANPWLDLVICRIPYCDNKIGMLASKTLLFAVFIFVIYRYTVIYNVL